MFLFFNSYNVGTVFLVGNSTDHFIGELNISIMMISLV